ncbi:DUF29 domain-containing protein [Methylocystis sp. JAN1]|uniref:DUF29 domain-containing protein n=1 Tax=Methylocystis sp. JAN1 TaxID=3397211 RepID=UPI003FA31593
MSNARLYDDDFYAWANEQAALLRAGKFSGADIEHIAEEIESMGKTEKRELAARETEFDVDEFPGACPWTFEQMMDRDFWPE